MNLGSSVTTTLVSAPASASPAAHMQSGSGVPVDLASEVRSGARTRLSRRSTGNMELAPAQRGSIRAPTASMVRVLQTTTIPVSRHLRSVPAGWSATATR